MNDRTLLVPGGAGNIGRAVVRALLEAGARVAVPFHSTDRHDALAALKQAHPDRILEFGMDLTTDRGATEAVRRAVEWRQDLHGVAHLVGGYRGGARIADTTIEEWDRMLSLNLRSAFLVARAAIPEMIAARGGGLVVVSSRAARVQRAGHGAYAVSKAGLHTLVETIAEEYREQGIRANAILPGTVDTPDNRRAMPDADHERWTAPAEIARVVRFLLSSDAAAVNGAVLPVYGRS